MKLSTLTLSVLVFILVPMSGTTTGQTNELQKELSLPTFAIKKPYGNFNVDITYREEEAYAGNDSLEVLFRVSTLGKKKLRFAGIESDDIANNTFNKMRMDREEHASDDERASVYHLIFGIKKEAIPQIYHLKVRLEAPEKDKHEGDDNYNDVIVPFPLNVGTRENGLLRVIPELHDNTAVPASETGSLHNFKIVLKNEFPKYPVKLEKIELNCFPDGIIEGIVSTNPAGIVNDKVITFTDPLIIPASQRQTLHVTVRMSGLTLSSVRNEFFDQINKLEVAFQYSDGHGRRVSDLTHKLEFKVRPSTYTLFIAIAIGVLIGTGVKYYLQRLREAGAITRRQQVSFAFATIIIGIVVALGAWVGRIQVLVLDFRGSYDNPLVVAFIGLAGAIAGPSLFNKILKHWPDSTPKTQPE